MCGASHSTCMPVLLPGFPSCLIPCKLSQIRAFPDPWSKKCAGNVQGAQQDCKAQPLISPNTLWLGMLCVQVLLQAWEENLALQSCWAS